MQTSVHFDKHTITFNDLQNWIQKLLQNKPKQTQLKLVNLQNFTVEELQKLKQANKSDFSILLFSPQLSKLNSQLLQQQFFGNKMCVKDLLLTINGKSQYVSVRNIVRLEANSNYTNFYIDKFHKPIVTSKSLKNYVNQLNPQQFVRTHRSHLVNIDFIYSLNVKPGKFLTLKDGTLIKISRRKLTAIKQLLKVKLSY